MQIRIYPDNEKALRKLADRNRRTDTQEGNVAIEEYIKKFPEISPPKQKRKP
jgi:hypothetical protein